MNTTYDVRIWKIGKARSKTRPHMVRWVTAGQVHTETFATYPLADSFRSDLVSATRRGEPFEITKGLPPSMRRKEETNVECLSWLAFCRQYIEVRWDGMAAKTRDAVTDSLATATLAIMPTGDKRPDGGMIRRALRWAVIPANRKREPPDDLATAVTWLEKTSPPVGVLAQADTANRLVDQLARSLTGREVAGNTKRRRRRDLNPAMDYAVKAGYLEQNPLSQVARKRVAVSGQVDRRVLASPRQVRELLTALSYVGSYQRGRGRRLVAFFATLYYAGPRPAEVLALTKARCQLPETGWGSLVLGPTLPVAGKAWTNTGRQHDERGLKQRDPDAERVVPIPPELVRILREHIDTFGVAPGGRLFQNERGGIVGASTYSRTWEEARQLVLSPEQAASPLAGRPYDLRHAALTTWLNAGVPPAEVAKRAGNSVEVLLKTYAGCIDGQQDLINQRIEALLGA